MLLDIDEGRGQNVALCDVAIGDNGDLGGARAVRWTYGRVARVDEVRGDGVQSTANLALCAVWRAGLLYVLGAGTRSKLNTKITSNAVIK